MNSRQEGKYGMYRRLSDLLKKEKQIVQTLPEVEPILADFDATMIEIGILNRKQETDISGLRTQKDQRKSDAIELSLDMSKRVVAYTKLHPNESLYQEVSYAKGDLLKLGDESFVSACWVIYSAAERNMNVLEAFGVNAESMQELYRTIEAFSLVIHVPKEAYTEKTLTTRKMGDMFDSMDNTTEKLDALVELLKRSNPDFYAAYQSARKVVQRHGSYMAKGQITDAATGEAVIGAMINFVLNGETMFVKLSADGGGFLVKTMDEGVYSVTVSKMGYITQTIPFTVDETKLAVLEVALVKG